jgi:formate-nitrite transporter family protein
VYWHFPLREIHPHAQHAAEAAEIAHDAGQFWAMHELLFRNQRALEDDDLVQYAAQLGIAEAGVRQALRTRSTAGRIAEDVRSGQASNVRGTPALFINGLRYRGKRDTNTLDAALRLPSTATVIPIQTTGEPTNEPTKRVNGRRPLGDGASDE